MKKPANWVNTVMSSNVQGFGYEQDSQQLHVMFKSGSMYIYERVPESVFEGFKAAPSKGVFFHNEIKDNYSYTKGKR